MRLFGILWISYCGTLILICSGYIVIGKSTIQWELLCCFMIKVFLKVLFLQSSCSFSSSIFVNVSNYWCTIAGNFIYFLFCFILSLCCLLTMSIVFLSPWFTYKCTLIFHVCLFLSLFSYYYLFLLLCCCNLKYCCYCWALNF